MLLAPELIDEIRWNLNHELLVVSRRIKEENRDNDKRRVAVRAPGGRGSISEQMGIFGNIVL